MSQRRPTEAEIRDARRLLGVAPGATRVVILKAWRDAVRAETSISETELTEGLYQRWFIAWRAPVDLTAQASPLQSLNFATLRVKDLDFDRCTLTVRAGKGDDAIKSLREAAAKASAK